MKVGDRVEIRRGVWKGHTARVTEMTSGGARVGVDVQVGAEWLEAHPFDAQPDPFSLAATSVRLLADQSRDKIPSQLTPSDFVVSSG